MLVLLFYCLWKLCSTLQPAFLSTFAFEHGFMAARLSGRILALELPASSKELSWRLDLYVYVRRTYSCSIVQLVFLLDFRVCWAEDLPEMLASSFSAAPASMSSSTSSGWGTLTSSVAVCPGRCVGGARLAIPIDRIPCL